MKKLMIIATALLFMAGYTVKAQTGHSLNNKKDQDQKQGMMMQKSEMMQGMMDNERCSMCGQMMNQDMPMQKYGMIVNKLPTMQKQLSLTDEQTEQLYELQADFEKQQVDLQSELREKQMRLKSLLADNASASQVKSQMEECSETRINMGIAAYEIAGKMKALLTNDQKELMKKRMIQMHDQGGMMDQDQDGMMKKSDEMKHDKHNH